MIFPLTPSALSPDLGIFFPESGLPTAQPPEEHHGHAWSRMVETGRLPDDADCLRPETAEAWLRCIEDHRLPLGDDIAPGTFRPVSGMAADLGGADIVALLDRVGPLLSGTRLSLLVTSPDATLLYLAESAFDKAHAMRESAHRGADWREAVLGNNGPSTAALTGRPAAFTGPEHFSRRLHPYATIGYPLEGPNGRIVGVIGLVGDRSVGASVLIAIMGLIVRLLAAETPLRHTGDSNPDLRLVAGEASRAICSSTDATPPSYRDSLVDDLTQQAMRLQYRKIPILITGESGAGKEHLVRLIHAHGPRSRRPLVAINCAAIPRDLIESELFGYEGGSFTGARSQGKPGKFLLADRGVLFLDEIGDMSFDLQATLLRVLERSEFVPIGGTRPICVDIHVIAATNVRLLDAVEQGRFRRDLYYRLNGAQMRLPPLRDRHDKRELIEFLLHQECEDAGVAPKRLSPEVREIFNCHPWPGNIRQLRNVLRSVVSVTATEVLTARDLPEDFLEEMLSAAPVLPRVDTAEEASGISATPPSLQDWECLAIEDALRKAGGNVAETARILGISRSTLYVKLQRYKLVPERRCR